MCVSVRARYSYLSSLPNVADRYILPQMNLTKHNQEELKMSGLPWGRLPDSSISVSGKLVLVIVSLVPGSLHPVSSLSSLIWKLIFKLLLLSLFSSNKPYSPAYPPSNYLPSIPPPSGRKNKRGKTWHHQSTLTSVDRLTSSQKTPSTYKNLFSSVVLSAADHNVPFTTLTSRLQWHPGTFLWQKNICSNHMFQQTA